MRIQSTVKKKILILLLGGVALGLTTSPRAQKRIFQTLVRDWKNINRQKLYRNISALEKHKFIRYQREGQFWNIELTEEGKRVANEIGINEIRIKNQKNGTKSGGWYYLIFQKRKGLVEMLCVKK